MRPAGLIVVLAILLSVAPVAVADERPSLRHGLAQVLAGALFELPKTVLDATLSNPPVIGTAVGLLAGTIGAVQKIVGGLVEISRAFKPWG